MNCECIYYSKGATVDDLRVLSEKVKEMGRIVEIYPCAISRMEESAKCNDDYDGWGRTMNIPKYSAVLFVGGKLHYMNPIRIGRRVFNPWHPMDDPVFADLETFDE